MDRIMVRIACLSCLVVISCAQKQPPLPPPVPVNLFSVSAQQVEYFDRYTATIVALSQVNLLPEVQGYLTGIFFKEGTHVKKGQKLYEIDRRIYDASYNAAAANLKVADGNLRQAQQDADRYEYLYNNKAIAKQLYDHAMITLDNSRNSYKSAEEALKTASTNLAYSTISAPFDGTVGFSQVKLGDLMSVGQTVLITISTDDPMGVDFLISEKQLAYFDFLRDNASKDIDSLFTLIRADNSVYPYPGTLSVIDRAVNPQTGAIRIRLLFPNPKKSLRPGMSCVVRVRNADTTPQLVVPSRAVVEEMGEYFVYVARDTSMGGPGAGKDPQSQKDDPGFFAFQRKVLLGATIGPNVIIRTGISAGERIVTDGVQSLHNGSAIAAQDDHLAASKRGKDGEGAQDQTQGKR